MFYNNKSWIGILLSLSFSPAYAVTGYIFTDSIVEFYTFLFLVYIISLMSVGFCVWIRWEQEVIRRLMISIDKNNIEIQRRLDRFDAELSKMQDRSPFPNR